MHKPALLLAAAVTVLALSVQGCSNSGDNESRSPSPAAPPPTTSTTTAATVDHNQADVTFAHNMIAHHQQAVKMSDMLLAKQGIDPRVIDLANKIKAAQGPEIQTMQGWLAQWGAPPSSSAAPMPGMDNSGMPAMPGLMSDQDMAALQNAQGVDASKTFLGQMIQHHQGAITMAQNEITMGQNRDAIALAKSISSTQQQETKTMQDILSTL